MISPALFNIYAVSLIQVLKKEGWSEEDILAFADDHLIICDSLCSLERAIAIVKSWCQESNITLNPQKSGILEVVPSRKKPELTVGSLVSGILIVDNYRYLGLVLDPQLNGEAQLKKMQQKINFLHYHLAPILRQVSPNYRINLWKLLVRPLFKPVIGISYLNTKTRMNKLEISLKKSLKSFLGLSIRTPNGVLEKLSPINIQTLGSNLILQAEHARSLCLQVESK